MEAPEEMDWHTTPGGDELKRADDAPIRVSRKPLVQTPGNVGHVPEAEGKVLVVGDVS